MNRALALLPCVALLACASAPTATVLVPAAAGAAPPVVTAPSRDALVWTLDEKGKPTTFWLRASADGYVTVAETPEALIAVGADVWRWRTKDETLPTSACEGGIEHPAGAGEGVEGFVERLGAPGTDRVIAPAAVGGANEINQGVTLAGSVGPYLFVRESTYTYTCGAHGGFWSSLVVWDLASRGKADILSPAEQQRLDSAERAEASHKLPAFDEPLKLDDVEFRGALPRYASRGSLSFDYAFTTFACYACSQGGWASYTTAIDIPARHVPERARPFVRPSSIVAAWAAAHPGANLGGWSEISSEAARVLTAAGIGKPSS